MGADQVSVVRTPHTKERPYFSMARTSAQDDTLSWEARGVLAYLLSKPDDWQVQIKDLQQHCGRDKVRAILKELVNAGYLTVEQKTNPKTGKFLHNYYRVYETPFTEKPSTVEPSTANPPLTYNREEQSTEGQTATGVAVVVLDGLNDFLKALAEFADSKRDVVFEATSTQLLEIDYTALGKNDAVRGRVNGLAKVARVSFEGVYSSHFADGWTRPLEDKCAAAITQFVKDWRSQKNIALPTGRDKFGTEFLKFLQAAAKPKRLVVTIAPQKTTLTQAELDAARDLARSIPRREVTS